MGGSVRRVVIWRQLGGGGGGGLTGTGTEATAAVTALEVTLAAGRQLVAVADTLEPVTEAVMVTPPPPRSR
jgi:hypothetical protein